MTTEMKASDIACSMHKSHIPTNLTVELHHIVPVAWQLMTTVITPPFPGKDPDGRGVLWDARGAWICPTGHRNVHHYIVQMMEWLKSNHSEDLLMAWSSLVPYHNRLDAKLAFQALKRYSPYGQFATLLAHGELGQS